MSFPLSKQAIDAPPRPERPNPNFDLVNCPICQKLVVIEKGEKITDHYFWKHPEAYKQLNAPLEKRNLPPLHDKPKSKQEMADTYFKEQKEPGMAEIENFKYEPSKLEPKVEGQKCDKCGSEMEYNDEQEWAVWDCPKCGNWKDADEEGYNESGESNEIFKPCPKCGEDMDIFPAEAVEYWVCDNCGHNEKVEADEADKAHTNKTLDNVINKHTKRNRVVADQITPQIWLGDIGNGWFMRDHGSGKPFDAILNVSQHEYTPPPDVEYKHLYIEEYA